MKARPKWAIALLLAASVILPAGAGQGQSKDKFELVSTIAFSSTRNDPTCNPFLAAEIYLMSPDGTNVQQLTNNDGCTHSDGFAALSPDGKRVIFDSNRLTTNSTCGSLTGLVNITDVFLMGSDGSELTGGLTRGSRAKWSPDGKFLAFNASASYYASGGSTTGCPTGFRADAPPTDSAIFVANVDDLLAGVAIPTNITNTPGTIEDHPVWSPILPDGTTKIAFTRRSANYRFCPPDCDYPDTEIYVINADGTGLTQLTHNDYEERSPAWSPDGLHIAFMCRIGQAPPNQLKTFQICVMDASGDANGTIPPTQLTFNSVLNATLSWSPDGQQILFHRPVVDPISGQSLYQLFLTSADGSGGEVQLTNPPGLNGFANWGELRVHVPKQ